MPALFPLSLSGIAFSGFSDSAFISSIWQNVFLSRVASALGIRRSHRGACPVNTMVAASIQCCIWRTAYDQALRHQHLQYRGAVAMTDLIMISAEVDWHQPYNIPASSATSYSNSTIAHDQFFHFLDVIVHYWCTRMPRTLLILTSSRPLLKRLYHSTTLA